jgi:hypothetical protein
MLVAVEEAQKEATLLLEVLAAVVKVATILQQVVQITLEEAEVVENVTERFQVAVGQA